MPNWKLYQKREENIHSRKTAISSILIFTALIEDNIRFRAVPIGRLNTEGADEESKSTVNDALFTLKMHSFVYNQLGTDVFQDMLIYFWQKAV